MSQILHNVVGVYEINYFVQANGYSQSFRTKETPLKMRVKKEGKGKAVRKVKRDNQD